MPTLAVLPFWAWCEQTNEFLNAARDPHYQRLSRHRQDSSDPAQQLLKHFSFCTILPGFLRDIRLLKLELQRSTDRKARAGRDSKLQSLLQKCSPNLCQWLTSCRPRATSIRDPLSGVPREATPAWSRSWTGQVHVKLPSRGWQCSCSRAFWWRDRVSEFQTTCGCRHREALRPGHVCDTNYRWSDLRRVLYFYWQRFITMYFCWVGGGKLSETCRNKAWAQALEKTSFQQSFHLPLLSLSSRRRLWSSL